MLQMELIFNYAVIYAVSLVLFKVLLTVKIVLWSKGVVAKNSATRPPREHKTKRITKWKEMLTEGKKMKPRPNQQPFQRHKQPHQKTTRATEVTLQQLQSKSPTTIIITTKIEINRNDDDKNSQQLQENHSTTITTIKMYSCITQKQQQIQKTATKAITNHNHDYYITAEPENWGWATWGEKSVSFSFPHILY